MHHSNSPPFSQAAAYQDWHTFNMKNWKLDPNPLDSAKKLIMNTSILNSDEGDAPKLPRIQLIENVANEDYDCLALCVLEILNVWHCQVRELIIDSACEYS